MLQTEAEQELHLQEESHVFSKLQNWVKQETGGSPQEGVQQHGIVRLKDECTTEKDLIYAHTL